MNNIQFEYDGTCLIKGSAIAAAAKGLAPEIKNLRSLLDKGYDTEYASINLPQDDALLAGINKTIKAKRKLKPTLLVVIGIGGSNLGTIAVHEAVQGKAYNDADPPMRVFFPDTVDSDKVGDFLNIAEDELKEGNNILVNVVTKSGKTTETIALFEMFAELLRKYKGKGYGDYVIATTDKDSVLWGFAEEEGYTLLEIPRKVGGRYSVFSAVGLFPLGMLGLDIEDLQSGAASMIKRCTETDIEKNPAALSAIIQYIHNKKGKNISDLFIFSSDLEAVGKWYRQLMGESIGKEWNRGHTKKVRTGMTPTVSIGSTDLHSMAQLYLGGPKDKFTTFVRVKRNKHHVNLPFSGRYDTLVEMIQGRDLHNLMDAILDGVEVAFRKAKLPFVEVVLPDKTEHSIGQLLQFKMFEMIYLAYLLDVNPFDQPDVESYKKETRDILSKG